MATIGKANDPQSYVLTLPDENTPASPFSAMFQPMANSFLAALVRLKNQLQSMQHFTDKVSLVDSNWAITAQTITVYGENLALLHLQMQRKKTTLSVPSDGNLANPIIAKFAAGFEPQAESGFQAGDSGRLIAGYALSDGNIKLAAVNSGKDIAVDDYITLVGNYILNNPVYSSI